MAATRPGSSSSVQASANRVVEVVTRSSVAPFAAAISAEFSPCSPPSTIALARRIVAGASAGPRLTTQPGPNDTRKATAKAVIHFAPAHRHAACLTWPSSIQDDRQRSRRSCRQRGSTRLL